jgi:hypothetical protein
MRKWEVVEGIVAQEAHGGRNTYPIAIVGLAALKADVLAIGLKK